MQDLPKIIQAKADVDRSIEISYDNGITAKFNFENFFEYRGYYNFLINDSDFLKILIEPYGHYVFWINESTQEEVEIDPYILYSICSKEKIIHDNKIVFDPSLGKNAWK